MTLETTVDRQSAGMRLDIFVTRRFSKALEQAGLSRSAIKRMIVQGQVALNGQRAKASARLKVNDIIRIQSLPPKKVFLVGEPLPLDVLYEDNDCIVINKAPGVVVHPTAARSSGTLVNALLHHCPDLEGIGGERRPGIVHRLDKETSGVMIAAKNALALQQLARQFKERRVTKEYLAVVWGKLKGNQGVIDRPVGRHRSDRKRMSSTHSIAHSKEAITAWKVERSFEIKAGSVSTWVSLLRLKPRTGRTHQIRVHLADLGYPLIGEKIYGRKRRIAGPANAKVTALQSFARHALHAEKLGLAHPRSGVAMQFHAPLTEDIHELLEFLEGQNRSAKVQPFGRDRSVGRNCSEPGRVDKENTFK
ncbi:MAG: RluA family pseudouridine synthase [Candidatus Binatia bacterium]